VITLDTTTAVPPYEQVRDQVRAQVESGELAPGTKLPTVRALASELGLAANTVARAYRELEAIGVIETRGRAGSVVSGQGVEHAARLAAHEFAARMRALGIGEHDALDLVRRALEG
jgi:DNA-binding transcriptional regulator YhcF (GntR family)